MFGVQSGFRVRLKTSIHFEKCTAVQLRRSLPWRGGRKEEYSAPATGRKDAEGSPQNANLLLSQGFRRSHPLLLFFLSHTRTEVAYARPQQHGSRVCAKAQVNLA